MNINGTRKSITIFKLGLDYYNEKILEVASSLNISKVEADVLLFFYNNPNFNNAKDVVLERKISKSYVSKAINKLLNKGYISLSVDEEDKRYQKLTLNDSVKDIVNELVLAQENILKSFINGVSCDELNVFLSVIKKIENNIIYLKERK